MRLCKKLGFKFQIEMWSLSLSRGGFCRSVGTVFLLEDVFPELKKETWIPISSFCCPGNYVGYKSEGMRSPWSSSSRTLISSSCLPCERLPSQHTDQTRGLWTPVALPEAQEAKTKTSFRLKQNLHIPECECFSSFSYSVVWVTISQSDETGASETSAAAQGLWLTLFCTTALTLWLVPRPRGQRRR